jgi:hypothetical protein
MYIRLHDSNIYSTTPNANAYACIINTHIDAPK